MEFKTLGNTTGKILLIGDMHLHTKEMASTKKMVQNNIVMLENIYDTLVNDTNINLVIFLGDIQHLTPNSINSTRETYRWAYLIRKIGELMADRYMENQIVVSRVANNHTDKFGNYSTNEHGLKIPYTEDINQSILDKKILPLFTLRGNHDIDTSRVNGLEGFEDSDLLPFTFYDYCITEGLMINPEQLYINDELLINFYSYGEVEKVYDSPSGVKHTIGLYHDFIDSPAFEDSILGAFANYSPQVAIKSEDVVFLGHLHTRKDTVIVEVDGREVPLVVVGSMGRTSTGESQIRDIGHCHVIDTSDLNIAETLEIDVIPAVEYFKLKEKLAQDIVKKEVMDFSLSLADDSEISEMLNAKDLISNLSIDNSIKVTCIDLLVEIENNI